MRRAAEDAITLNGSHGEGGGALFKAALAMSALTLKPLTIHSIRGATRKPGMTAEDFAFLSALSTACNARLEADEIGSNRLSFVPQRLPQAVHFDFDITRIGPGKTPGNCLAVAQALAAPLSRTGAYSTISLQGETHNNNTLTFDAFELSTIRAHAAQGLGIYANLMQAGFGFAGRGDCRIEIEPSALQSIEWPTRGELKSVIARITAVNMHSGAITDARTAIERHMADIEQEPQVEVIEIGGPETGLSVLFAAQFERGFGSSSACLNRGGRATDAVDRAWGLFDEFMGSTASVDPFLADQLLMTAALAEGRTVYTTSNITRRLQTIAWVIKQFLPIAITIKGTEGAPGTITVQR